MNQVKNPLIKMEEGKSCREGVIFQENNAFVDIVVWAKDRKKCKLCLYLNGKRTEKIPMYPRKEQGVPDLFGIRLMGEQGNIYEILKDYEYDFETEEGTIFDPYARQTAGREKFGKKGKLRGRFYVDDFDWSGENRIKISFDDMILYQCHLRGFTKHKSSQVKNPGTFDGFTEKLDYIKDLGVNTILMMPIYDFDEWMEESQKINFWGYTKNACYMAPKSSYAADPENAVNELKSMIKAIHQKGLNIFLDIFLDHLSPAFMIRCLNYYATEFHIDGFLVDTDVVRKEWIENHPVLRRCKFLGTYWEQPATVDGEKMFACYNDRFQTAARRYLKSDEGQVYEFYQAFKEDYEDTGVVHYITQKNGFTLRDLVSYDVKHNEANGEKNNDGTEYNYSWNCGQEGTTRRKAVLRMRMQQEKNALCMMMLGPSTPMILAGDERGRTQKGNNNAYCLDNALTWVHWEEKEQEKEIYSYVKELIRFRKEHKLYQQKKAFCGMDWKGVGVPDISAHGTEPWEANYSYYSRELGVFFYGSYYGGNSLYYAFNFHWDAHTFYLPITDQSKEWKILLDTADSQRIGEVISENEVIIGPRSIVVLEHLEYIPKKK